MNSITMKLQADELIRLALQEDITSEDVSTNAVMPAAQQGTVDLIAKEKGIMAGLDVYAVYLPCWIRQLLLHFRSKTEIVYSRGI